MIKHINNYCQILPTTPSHAILAEKVGDRGNGANNNYDDTTGVCEYYSDDYYGFSYQDA